MEEAELARDNGVLIEITGRMGHNITNGHVVKVAREAGAKMIVDSDTHAPENLMDEAAARIVARGAGMTDEEVELAINVTPFEAIKSLRRKRIRIL